MRRTVLALALVPATLAAQTAADPRLARVLPNTDALATTAQTVAANRAATLTSGLRKDAGPVSENEAYNIGRAASGRLGVRLGNGESFPVGTRVPR